MAVPRDPAGIGDQIAEFPTPQVGCGSGQVWSQQCAHMLAHGKAVLARSHLYMVTQTKLGTRLSQRRLIP